MRRATFTQLAALLRSVHVAPVNLSSGTVLTVDVDYFLSSLTGNRTLTISGTPSEGSSISLVFTTDGTARTLTFPSCRRVAGSSSPAVHAVVFAASKSHRFLLEYINSGWWLTDTGND